MTSLAHAQELLGKPGLLSTILISNKGGYLEGEALTDQVVDRFNDLPALKEAGLEVFGVKQRIVGIANEVGNIFVSLFTTFGLFSIGVGLLLIFLIFTMLAAERKSEMGIARAVGMQRSHLVRAFLAEGAFYSIGVGDCRFAHRSGTGIPDRRGRRRDIQFRRHHRLRVHSACADHIGAGVLLPR